MRVALMAAVGLVACSSGRMFQEKAIDQAVPTASGPPPPLPDDPATQIDKLHADVLARRAALSLPTPPAGPTDTCEPVCTIADPPAAPTHTAGCTPGAGSACAATCAQADAACDDAAQLCAIAKQLKTEALAASRCQDASASCAEAHAPCCDCK